MREDGNLLRTVHRRLGKQIDAPTELTDEPFIGFSEREPPAWRNFSERRRIGRRISGNADNVYEVWWLIGLG